MQEPSDRSNTLQFHKPLFLHISPSYPLIDNTNSMDVLADLTILPVNSNDHHGQGATISYHSLEGGYNMAHSSPKHPVICKLVIQRYWKINYAYLQIENRGDL